MSSFLKVLTNDPTIFALALIIVVTVASVTALGIDAAFSSTGNGTIVGFETIGKSGNYSIYTANISTSHGNFLYRLKCLNIQVGDAVSYDHDLMDGYVLVGQLPDSCTG